MGTNSALLRRIARIFCIKNAAIQGVKSIKTATLASLTLSADGATSGMSAMKPVKSSSANATFNIFTILRETPLVLSR